MELKQTSIASIVRGKRDLLSVESSELIGNVLDLLHQENLTSIAIWGQQGRWIGAGFVELVYDQKQFIGIISILDILHYVLTDSTSRINHSIFLVIGSTRESLSLWLLILQLLHYNYCLFFCKNM